MNIAIFGGSFDPFHKGHLYVLQEANKEVIFDKIIIIPTYQNPNKTRPLLSSKQRLVLLEKNLSNIQQALNIADCILELSTHEQTKTSYTIDTLKHFHKLYPQKNLHLILGSDSFLTLHLWKQYLELSNYCKFIIVRRDKKNEDLYKTYASNKLHLKTSQWILCKNKPFYVASSKIKLQALHSNTFLLKSIKKDLQKTLKKPFPYIIGITGRMGSGKSTALKIFAANKDTQSIELDLLGHNCLKHPDIKKKLCLEFGNKILIKQQISRKLLGDIVFKNSHALKTLNTIVHPFLIKQLKDQIKQCKKPYLFIAGALLFELNIHTLCHISINIETSNLNILKNNKYRFHILKHQLSKKTFRQKATLTLINHFDHRFAIKCKNTFLKIKESYI